MGYLILLKFLSKNFWIWEEGYTYITRKFDCAVCVHFPHLSFWNLKATGIEVGLLINFGRSVSIKRRIMDKIKSV
jgi:hypothetical protein